VPCFSLAVNIVCPLAVFKSIRMHTKAIKT
jgi:hypothetical protein